MATALEICEAEIAAMGRFHDAKRGDLIALGQECRVASVRGESPQARHARQLAGRIVLYRDMAHQALRAARSYKAGTGKVPPAVMHDFRYYRRCAHSIARELREMAPVVVQIAAE